MSIYSKDLEQFEGFQKVFLNKFRDKPAWFVLLLAAIYSGFIYRTSIYFISCASLKGTSLVLGGDLVQTFIRKIAL